MEFSRRVRLILSYDGTEFHGWQKQKSGMGIQNVLDQVLSQILNQEISTVGSGRTDSGVHALAQNAHFDLQTELKHPDLIYGANRLLPRSIRIQKAFFAPAEFHAQRSAQRKTYRYRVLQSDVACPLRRHFTWWCPQKLDIDKLNALAREVTGKKDFKSFQSTGTDVRSTVRHIHQAQWTRQGDELVFEVTGNGFLKQMVRNIVGVSVEYSLNEADPAGKMRELMAAKDRREMGAPALAQGLCLVHVEYPRDLESQCTPLPKKISH